MYADFYIKNSDRKSLPRKNKTKQRRGERGGEKGGRREDWGRINEYPSFFFLGLQIMKRANVSFYIVKNPRSKIQKEKGEREKQKEERKREKRKDSPLGVDIRL